MEDSDGTDSPLTTLRATIQKLERSGSVDFELAGHSFERPPEVCQGAEQGDRLLGHTVCRRQSTLRFQVTVKDSMVWKPSAVQLKNVKQKNGASYFDAQLCLASPVIQQAGDIKHPSV